MATDNLRLLKDEKALLETEAAFAREEATLLQRLEGLLAVSYESAGRQLIARIDALESAGVQSPDLGRAKAVISAGIAPDPVLSETERAAALKARQASLVARENALKSLVTAMGQLEALKQRRVKEFEAVEAFVSGTETAVRQMLEQQRAAEVAPPAPAPVAPPPVAKAPPAPEPVAPPPVAKAKEVAPAPPKAVEPPKAAEPKQKEKVVAPPPAPAKPAIAAAPVAAKPAAGPGAKAPTKKVSRRRRTRVAPPPKKLEVEVQVYGDNNFYTGFESKIASGGVFVASVETLPPGHELEVELDLEGKKFKARGKVEFVRLDNSASPDCTPGAGLKLSGLSGDSVAAIESFFQKRPPLFVMPMQSAA